MCFLTNLRHQRIVDDPTSAPVSLGVCGAIMGDEALQMASELVEGLSEFFLCRTLRD